MAVDAKPSKALLNVIHHGAKKNIKGAPKATLDLLVDLLRHGPVDQEARELAATVIENISSDDKLAKRALAGSLRGKERITSNDHKSFEYACLVYDHQQAGHPLQPNTDDVGAFYLAARDVYGSDPSDAQVETLRRSWNAKKKLVKEFKVVLARKLEEVNPT